MVLRVVVLGLLSMVFLGSPGAATTCFSKSFYTAKLKTVLKDARRLKMQPSIVKCIWRHGMSFKPESVELSPGTKIVCYEDDLVIRYLVNVLNKCVTESKPRSGPSSRSAKRGAARELVLQGTTRRRGCGCTSGCHYCCVMTGIGGHTWCFGLYCGRRHYCY